MRKYFLATIGFLLLGLAILAPNVVSAAYNDVTFDDDITVTIGSYDYTIDQSSVLEEFAVGATTLTVEMEVGSRLIMSSADRMKMINDSGTETDCSRTSISTLDITGAADLTVVITPSGTCGTGGTGGGGGAAAPSAEPTPPEEEVIPEKPIEEMTAEELRTMIAEIQKQLIELIQQLIQLLQEQINQLLQES